MFAMNVDSINALRKPYAAPQPRAVKKQIPRWMFTVAGS